MLHTTYRTVLVSLVTSVILNVLQLLCWAPDSLAWGYQDSCIFYLAEFCAVALAIPSGYGTLSGRSYIAPAIFRQQE